MKRESTPWSGRGGGRPRRAGHGEAGRGEAGHGEAGRGEAVRGEAHSRTATQNDPEVFFSSERTLLAWVRTGIAMIALGFVVSRFGLFLQRLPSPSGPGSSGDQPLWSGLLGVAFAIAGTATIISAIWQHRRFAKSFGHYGFPHPYWRNHATFMSAVVAVLGVLLVAYLALV